ncbi:acetylglutamate kinase [Leptospira ilyithenensis]|uniref:Acetylglutamate kinase n=1 Tax=Leptospira ilyithenensis TaxID=2484901 RepID=A0A4R9LVD6_9LEPT|nr:acetylglutamate kinase [Leptospira ilyithenensis]TGN14648.1 acetylglutamate kinase [Leptospira ilyithenensis]
MELQLEKINHILEALPYLIKYSGKTIVIKYGGAAMIEEDLKASFAEDIVLLKYLGINPVVVHGGGPEINQLIKSLNLNTQFVRGHRVTDEPTMEVVEMVLTGKVNKQIVSLIQEKGGKTVGLSGKDGGLTLAEKYLMEFEDENGKLQSLDLGLVGKISEVNPSLIRTLQAEDFIPIISPVSVSKEGKTLNINADTMAGAIAASLSAEKLILVTDTPGILIDGQLVTGLNKQKIDEYIRSGQISGGMIPKVECCLDAMRGGVKRAHIIDGRVPHSVLIEVLTNQGIGSLIE